MSHYLKLRGQIYYYELKQMLSSVSQLFAFLMMVLYLAIPASILTALVSLSIIADIHTSTEQRIIYQWGYFILLYFLIRVQKNAILGQKYQAYITGLLIPAKQKYTATFLLTLIAGNLPLLAPIYLLTFIPDWHTFISQLHFPLFALSAIILAWISLKRDPLPWLSLLLTPLLLYVGLKTGVKVGLDQDPLSAITLNFAIVVLLIIEVLFEPLALINKTNRKIRHYWQIRWIAMMKKPANILSRIYFCGLFMGLVAYVQHKMGQEANVFLQLLICWLFAIVIGSYQFDNERFYRKYQHYLNGLLNRHLRRYWLDILPAIFIAVTVSLLMKLWLNFSVQIALLLPLGVLITIVSVSKFQRNFFILPCLCYALLMVLANVLIVK